MQSMQLDTFIKESLLAIIDGVVAAQDVTERGRYARVNPGYDDLGPEVGVTFDVAVTVAEGKGGKARLSVLGPVSAGVKGGASTESTAVHRLSFTLPVRIMAGSLPTDILP